MYVEQNQHKPYNNAFLRVKMTGAVIREFRKTNNLSQGQLANMVCEVGEPYNIKVSPVTISSYERNICQPKMEITWALCEVMHIDTATLHGYQERPYMIKQK